MSHADTRSAYKQGVLPIRLQLEDTVRENRRLIECWLGIRYTDSIGDVFCVDCQYLSECKGLYKMIAGTRRRHPAIIARKLLVFFGIDSDYLKPVDQEEVYVEE